MTQRKRNLGQRGETTESLPQLGTNFDFNALQGKQKHACRPDAPAENLGPLSFPSGVGGCERRAGVMRVGAEGDCACDSVHGNSWRELRSSTNSRHCHKQCGSQE